MAVFLLTLERSVTYFMVNYKEWSNGDTRISVWIAFTITSYNTDLELCTLPAAPVRCYKGYSRLPSNTSPDCISNASDTKFKLHLHLS